MEQTGVNALAHRRHAGFSDRRRDRLHQGADQLAQFGAQILTVNLLGISVLRELGCLITAIIVAGRSGSAFTAEIGAMRVNEEIDALQVPRPRPGRSAGHAAPAPAC